VAWRADEENKLFVRTALRYYTDHVKRFGLDEHGWPKAETHIDALEAAHTALMHVQRAHESFAALPGEKEK
jgi:hypothetical protein